MFCKFGRDGGSGECNRLAYAAGVDGWAGKPEAEGGGLRLAEELAPFVDCAACWNCAVRLPALAAGDGIGKIALL